MSPNDYSKWSNEQLIERVTKLEQQLKEQSLSITSALQRPTSPSVASQKKKKQRSEGFFDPSRYHTRFIALKLAYLGQDYNGFEHHNNNTTPLPTIEEELWKALNKTKLIFPTNNKEGEIDWDGCEYSKCGRTDRGVSAFGQVIGIRVRSSRPKKIKKKVIENGEDEEGLANSTTQALVEDITDDHDPSWHHIDSELSYPRILNRVLPPTIRILAWCPSPPSSPSPNDPNSPFSARFSCRERRYRYFFTNPCYSPINNSAAGLRRRRVDGKMVRDGWLDIEAMREAARYYEGAHDFRNFCKLDPGKQIENFRRVMFRSSIEEVGTNPATDGGGGLPAFLRNPTYGPLHSAEEKPKIYCFQLHGSAFLWHQVRHMVAILFLVGQGLEHPTIVRDMLDIEKTPSKPLYEMADDAPLVLWDCIFPDLNKSDDAGSGGDEEATEEVAESWTETTTLRNPNGYTDALEWIYVDEPKSASTASSLPKHNGTSSRKPALETITDGRFGPGGLQDVLWSEWRRHKMDEILAGSLLDIVARQGGISTAPPPSIFNHEANKLFNHDSSANEIKDEETPPFNTYSTKLFNGSNTPQLKGEYVPVLERERQESIEVQNRKFAERAKKP